MPESRVGVTGGCAFSPEADFAAGAVVNGIGVQTLRHMRVRRELIVSALPLLFGIHQLVEGFVWLGLRGEVFPGLGDTAKETYIVFAHAALPALVLLGFTLLRNTIWRSTPVCVAWVRRSSTEYIGINCSAWAVMSMRSL